MLPKIIYTFLIFFLFFQNGFNQTYQELIIKGQDSQMSDIDSSIHYYSLAEKLAFAKNDSSELINVYSALGNLHRIQQNFELSKKYTQLTYDVARTNYEKAVSLSQLGSVYEYIDLKKSDSIFQESEKISHTIKDTAHLQFGLYGNYAGVKKNLGDFYGAIDYFLKAEKLAPSDLPRANILLKVASIFLSIKNIDLAHEYIQKSIDLAEKNNYKMRHSSIALIYAEILKAQNKIPEAKEEVIKSLEYLKTTKKYHNLATAYNMMTDLYFSESDYESAIAANQKAFEYFEKTSPHSQITSMSNRCELYLIQNQFGKAVSASKEIIQMAKENNLKTKLSNGHYLASLAYEKNKQNELALNHFKKYKSLNDSLFQSEQTSLLTSLESKHNRTEQQNAITLLDSKNQIQANQLSQQKTFISLGSIALTIISGLLFFLFKSNKRIKTQNQLISKSLLEKDTLLREIHHRVKNNLQLVSSLLGLQSRTIEDPKALEALNSGKARVKSMALIHQDLYNRDNLTGIKVKDYLEKLCNELISTYQINLEKINLQTDIEDLNIDVDTLVPLGLIINELLTNALKYAFPNEGDGNIFVKLFVKNRRLFLEVKDDGVGIDISKRTKNSFGFKLVNTLLDQLDGNLNQIKCEGTHLVIAFDDFKIAA